MKRRKRPTSPWIFYLFIVPLLVVGLLYFVLPVNAVSESERRNLQGRPEFSWKGYFDGSYQEQVENFYQDQLPLREGLVAFDQGLNRFTSNLFLPGDTELIVGGPGTDDLGEGENLGIDDKEIITFRPTSTQPAGEVPTAVPPTDGLTDPVTEPSAEEPGFTIPPDGPTEPQNSETDPPVPTDEVPTDTAPTTPVTEPQITETVPATTVPAVTEPVTSATESAATTTPPVDDGPVSVIEGLLIRGERGMELFGYRDEYVDSYAELINALYTKVPEINHFNILAPTASEFYSPESYHSGMASQREMITKVQNKLNPGITRVDIYNTMQAHTDEYIYFRTDHHWTGLGAYYAYTDFARAAGFAPVSRDQMTYGVIEGDFLGSLYGISNQNPVLENNPDYVEYWEPQVETSGVAFLNPEMTEGYRINLISKNVSANNKYLAFTEGDHGLARFETSVKNGQSILVIKESYGNAIIPYLAGHFEEVYIIDPRRIELNLAEFIRGQGIGNVLTINYSSAVANPTWKNGLRSILAQ